MNKYLAVAIIAVVGFFNLIVISATSHMPAPGDAEPGYPGLGGFFSIAMILLYIAMIASIYRRRKYGWLYGIASIVSGFGCIFCMAPIPGP